MDLRILVRELRGIGVCLCLGMGHGRPPGEGNPVFLGEYSNPLQYSCLENSTDRSLVGCSPWGHIESDMTNEQTHT